MEKESQYKEIPPRELRTFQLEEDQLIHIIKTGFEDEYIVVYEDAYNFHMENSYIGSKKEIEFKFNINL